MTIAINKRLFGLLLLEIILFLSSVEANASCTESYIDSNSYIGRLANSALFIGQFSRARAHRERASSQEKVLAIIRSSISNTSSSAVDELYSELNDYLVDQKISSNKLLELIKSADEKNLFCALRRNSSEVLSYEQLKEMIREGGLRPDFRNKKTLQGLNQEVSILAVCDRSPKVIKFILRATKKNTCADVADSDLVNIKKLDFSNDPVESLRSGDFSGMSQLVSIELQNSYLSRLPPGIFSGLPSLERVNLYDSGLNTLVYPIPNNVFLGSSRLKYILLGDNLITHLPPSLFDGLSSLQLVNLDRMQSLEISDSYFFGFRRVVGKYNQEIWLEPVIGN